MHPREAKKSEGRGSVVPLQRLQQTGCGAVEPHCLLPGVACPPGGASNFRIAPIGWAIPAAGAVYRPAGGLPESAAATSS